MATPVRQTDPRGKQQRNNSDSEDENDPPRNIPLLYVPDLAITVLSEAIKDGMQVGNSGTEYIIPTPLLKDIVGIERLKVSLPEGELETCSVPPLDFVTKFQPTPFNLQLLTSALKDMRKENPELQYLAGEDWHPTYTRYLRQEELKDRLNAYTKLSVKYAKSVIELNAAQLILNTDERHRIEYSLELLLQCITNRLDEILNILARDNMLRKREKKRVYTLPRINPRAANLNSTEDAQKLGREIQDDVMEILHYAFNPIPEGEEDRIEVCYNGSDIPDDNTRRKKTNQPPTGHNNTTRVSTGQNADRPHHTVNFDPREQHRTSTLDEVQQRLTQMAQGNSSANTANIRPACLSDKPPSNRRWRNMAERYQRSNGQNNNSSAASDSGTSTGWDGCWGMQECSACRGEGHNTRNCRAKRNNELWCTRCNSNNHCNNTCRLAPRRSSTPRYTGNYHPHPSPCTGDDHTVPLVEPHFTTRPSPMIASQGTGNLELSQMLQTILRENNEEAKLKQQKRTSWPTSPPSTERTRKHASCGLTTLNTQPNKLG